ncbi:MAG: hypothetical protein KAX40_10465 [Herpetosiphon sp.]|nr:hypothetical protein [Herpetosiphon sp.]
MRRLLEPTRWNFDYLITAITFILLVGLALCTNVSSDTWWLLRTGQATLQQGSIVTTDLFSWTNYGNYWPNHEWLTQVLMYGAMEIGGIGLLVVLFALIIVATWIGVYSLSSGAARWRSLVLLLGIIDNARGWSLRPQVISVMLFVLVFFLIPRKRWHWLFVPLFLLWVNLHGGFAVGGALLAITTAVALVKFRAEFLNWLMISLACVAVTLINPHGWEMWTFTFNSLNRSTYQYISEWQPHSLTTLSHYPFFLLAGLTMWSLWRTRSVRRDLREWVLVIAGLIFMILAFRSIRQAVFFDVLAVPIITRMFANTKPMKTVVPQRGRLNQGIGGFMIVIMIGMIVMVWTQRQPILSSQIISSLRNCSGNIYNTYETGGELIWFVPEKPVFIDNRFDPYPYQLFLEASKVELDGDYQALFKRYPVTCALVPTTAKLSETLQRDGWQLKAQDSQLSVWEQP